MEPPKQNGDIDGRKYGYGNTFLDNYKILIKSTRKYDNNLLLETNFWSEDGIFLPECERYDFVFLVRTTPFCMDVIRSSDFSNGNNINREELFNIISKNGVKIVESKGFSSEKF